MCILVFKLASKKVVGIMHLGKPIHMEQIIENYDVGSKIYSRIKDSLNGGERFAIPIESLTLFKVPVCINTLKELDEHFTVPQCYLNLKNYPVVFNYLKKQECYDVEFLNSHNKIYEDNFAMTCKDMEQTKEFNEKDKLYLSQKKYSMIECGYITKKIRS